MRLRVVAVLVALTAAGALLGTQAGLASGASQSGGAPFDIRAVSVVVPLRTDDRARALAIYRALIPKGLSMPSDPVVAVWLAELSSGRYVSGRPMDDASHWIEGAIELRVRHGSEEGWYQILYPVTAEFWFYAGRDVGLPKRHATASITASGNGWVAQATPTGTSSPAIYMHWQPGPDANPAATALGFRAALDPFFALNSPLKGPQLERVQYFVTPPSPVQTSIPGGAPAYQNGSGPTPGAVQLRLVTNTDAVQESDLPKIFPPGTDLADMVNIDQTLPGDYYFYAVNLNDTSAVVGTGGYGPRQPITVAPSGGGRPRCTQARMVTLHLSKRRLIVVRVYVNGRRVRVRVLTHGKIRFTLSRRRGMQHVRIVAETSAHRVVVRRVSYPGCSSSRRDRRR